jgi:Ca2+-binding RTX toxin-like protein
MRKVLAGAAVAIAAMAAAPAAHGAVVSAVDNDFISTLEYDAGAAETNRVVATYALDATGNYAVTIEDRGAVITTTTPLGISSTGTGCTPTGLHRAVCHYRRNSIHSAVFQLGGGNDTFTSQGVTEDFSLYGGAGNDQLTGGTGTNYFEPGSGTDKVIGGAGFDDASYADHSTPVSITVDGQANDGSAGENDSLTGIEEYDGGSGDDTLTGSDAADRLVGGPGTDLITGAGGDDVLDAGGMGADHIVGGAGQDTLLAGLGGVVEAIDGEFDDIYCFGRANTLSTDSQDVAHDCPS